MTPSHDPDDAVDVLRNHAGLVPLDRRGAEPGRQELDTRRRVPREAHPLITISSAAVAEEIVRTPEHIVTVESRPTPESYPTGADEAYPHTSATTREATRDASHVRRVVVVTDGVSRNGLQVKEFSSALGP